jgi:hypothetical protein
MKLHNGLLKTLELLLLHPHHLYHVLTYFYQRIAGSDTVWAPTADKLLTGGEVTGLPAATGALEPIEEEAAGLTERF